MKIVCTVILFVLLLSVPCIAEPEITKEWNTLIEKYKTHMVVGEWNGAIQTAETLLKIDPSSSEAKFYLVYAIKKAGEKCPEWVDEPSTWANGTINDRFYIELAKEIDK